MRPLWLAELGGVLRATNHHLQNINPHPMMPARVNSSASAVKSAAAWALAVGQGNKSRKPLICTKCVNIY